MSRAEITLLVKTNVTVVLAAIAPAAIVICPVGLLSVTPVVLFVS